MSDVNVLVVFYSRRGDTEKMALAAGVGALQARANIRLRRVASRADQRTIDADVRWRETLERMKMDYIEPRAMDADWAELVVVATPADAMEEILEYVGGLHGAGLKGKTAAPLVAGANSSATERLCAACSAAGLLMAGDARPGPSDVSAAREYGRRAVEDVRLRRSPGESS
jgi:NAD(P)H dehydrogenase (quinone)